MPNPSTLHNPLISREQQDDANLVKWCRWVTFVLLLLCAPFDMYVIFMRGDWYKNQDQAAMQRQYYYLHLLLGVALITQVPLIIFCVPLVILTIWRGPSVAKRWAVNVLRGGECHIPSSSSI